MPKSANNCSVSQPAKYFTITLTMMLRMSAKIITNSFHVVICYKQYNPAHWSYIFFTTITNKTINRYLIIQNDYTKLKKYF